MGLHQLKGSAQQKNISKMKRQPMEWEKIFANHLSDKRLLSEIEKKKHSYDSIIKNLQVIEFFNGQGNFSRHFPKEDIHTINGYIKRCSTSLILK